MRLFSYVVARDFGFAPNPFGGVCTLATCKPDIRQRAMVGDWIAGIASAADSRIPSLTYVMRVDEVLTYDAYWKDPRFQMKKPSRFGSVKQLFGDNIYRRDAKGTWLQIDSHHSLSTGANPKNIANDTKSLGVLVGRRFAYWGSKAIPIPDRFLDFDGHTIRLNRGYKNKFSEEFVQAFVAWFESLGEQGFLAAPAKWQKPKSTWAKPIN
uniref:Nmad2 family putative nucleotide modification protein n=1 Tax=Cupriavidus taiwanensis TaxID=164546 RepID=UPI003F49B145